MKNIEVLSEEEILSRGIEFDGDVCFSGKYGQQVFNKPMEEGGEAITAILYEKYSNSQINYYSFYVDGFPDGQYVTFYKSGKIKSFCMMKEGVMDGEHIGWMENGNIEYVEKCKYGVKISYKKWDENGKLIQEKLEPTQFEKELIKKYDLQEDK